MLLEWRVMLYFNVIILVPYPYHLLKLLECLLACKNAHNGRKWFLYDLLWETTCLERPFLLGRRGGRPRQVMLYHWVVLHMYWISDFARSICPDQNISLLCVSIEAPKELLSRYRQYSTLNYITGFLIVVIAKCCRMKNGYMYTP